MLLSYVNKFKYQAFKGRVVTQTSSILLFSVVIKNTKFLVWLMMTVMSRFH